MAQFNIRIEYKTLHDASAFYDFAQFALTREAATFAAEERIQREFGPKAKVRWRGLVAFVNHRPAEEIAS